MQVKVNEFIAKRLKIQKRVFDTQMRNLRVVHIQEAQEYVKSKTEQISKHLTREHHKLIQRFQDFKQRTQSRLDEVDRLERVVYEISLKEALDNATKEGMYAMDETNPLRLYDCLIPEINAYRPLRLPISKPKAIANSEAKLKLEETKLKIVSSSLPRCFEDGDHVSHMSLSFKRVMVIHFKR